jgi:predicted metal-dependent phosphoesterase TrpH
MGSADLHIHTALGDGMAEIPELLDYVQETTELSVIAVTEHDDLRAAFAAREAWARGSYRYDFIVGEEVTTIEGHLLALFIEEPVPSLKPLAPTLEAVHKQGGLAIVAHPMSWLTRSLGRRDIERVLREQQDGVYFDAIELSGSLAARVSAKKVQRLNREQYDLPQVGNSDAHFLEAIGTSLTRFEGATATELRAAILAGKTSAEIGEYPSLRRIGMRRIVRQQWRGMMATPRQMGWIPTIASFVKRVVP